MIGFIYIYITHGHSLFWPWEDRCPVRNEYIDLDNIFYGHKTLKIIIIMSPFSIYTTILYHGYI